MNKLKYEYKFLENKERIMTLKRVECDETRNELVRIYFDIIYISTWKLITISELNYLIIWLSNELKMYAIFVDNNNQCHS